MAVLVFLRNVTSLFECLKIKIPEYSDPPLQQFSIPKASISNFVLCRKVTLCQSGRMAHYRLAHFVCIISSKKFGQTELIKMSNQCFSMLFYMQNLKPNNLEFFVRPNSNCEMSIIR